MSRRALNLRTRERGIVLISSLLLLLVITILALAMFRSMGLGEKISGNVREKTRALHAAVVAEQYAEWWLSSPGNASAAPVVCNTPGSANVSSVQVLICTNPINPTAAAPLVANPQNLPWKDGSGNQLGFTYFPNSTTSAANKMLFNTADSNGSMANSYQASPAFYIQYLGLAADGGGTVYKIDALGYGGNYLAVAVVESTYEIGSGVTNLGGL
jgi:type IV pilus assembly protein PilX